MRHARTTAEVPASWSRLTHSQQHDTRVLRLVRRQVNRTPQVDPVTSAEIAHLHHVDDATLPGIHRKGTAAHPYYVDEYGRRVRSAETIRRIKALVIPPAWTDVWICPEPDGPLQATGRDARGRQQSRY